MTRQEAAERAFQFYLNAVDNGRLGFCNLAYGHFWKLFEEKNDIVLEQENDSGILTEFVTERLIFSRAVLDNGHQSLIRKIIREMSESRALRGWALAKVLSRFSYRDQAKLMLYAWLTTLRRIGRNAIQEISKFPDDELAKMFNFNLVDDDVAFEAEQRQWIKGELEQKRDDFERQVEALAEFLGVSREEALQELKQQ